METTPVHVFARWKVKEGNIQEVLQLLKELRSQTLAEEGNLFYKINQSNGDASTLILLEGYKSAAAQQYHVKSDHYQRLALDGIVTLLSEREIFLTTPLDA